MSAYVVDKKLIDALLTFGLKAHYGPLHWLWPKTNHPATHERGVAIPAASVIVAQETMASLTTETADRVGQLLLDENVRSVNHRYDELDDAEPYTFRLYHNPNGSLVPANILGLIGCLNYQSCEHPEWDESEAYAVLEAIKSEAIHRLPGYDWNLPK